jgi:hypothetical protein
MAKGAKRPQANAAQTKFLRLVAAPARGCANCAVASMIVVPASRHPPFASPRRKEVEL